MNCFNPRLMPKTHDKCGGKVVFPRKSSGRYKCKQCGLAGVGIGITKNGKVIIYKTKEDIQDSQERQHNIYQAQKYVHLKKEHIRELEEEKASIQVQLEEEKIDLKEWEEIVKSLLSPLGH